jgi:predicted regulator of Ras-like GTPase activity (Roadblock/LC7/MglB family)
MSPVQPTGEPLHRSARLDQVISDLLREAPELEAAAVVSFDGLPMASALPAAMDEDRVAAMSAALLSLGERAAQGLGRGELSQVYIEGETGTVFLVSADDEAVLVAVAAPGAKVGMMLYEVRRAAASVAAALRADHDVEDAAPAAADEPVVEPAVEPTYEAAYEPAYEPAYEAAYEPVAEPTYEPAYDAVPVEAEVPIQEHAAEPVSAVAGAEWGSYAPGGTVLPGGDPGVWS